MSGVPERCQRVAEKAAAQGCVRPAAGDVKDVVLLGHLGLAEEEEVCERAREKDEKEEQVRHGVNWRFRLRFRVKKAEIRWIATSAAFAKKRQRSH